METDNLSDETIHAYISGELSEEENRTIESMAETNDLLKQKILRFRNLQSVLREAYQDEAGPSGYEKTGKPLAKNIGAGNWVKSIAVLSLVSVTALSSSLMTLWFDDSRYGGNKIITAGKENKVWRVVMHVSSSDKYLQNTLLDETEELLRSYRKMGKKLRVEIVAYGSGVSLIQTGKSAYAARINSLREKYSNLSVAACGKTLKRIQKLSGKKVTLLPRTTISVSGIRQIIKRQRQGWSYIRI